MRPDTHFYILIQIKFLELLLLPKFSLDSATPVSYWLKTGNLTPATLSVRDVTLTEALILLSNTYKKML